MNCLFVSQVQSVLSAETFAKYDAALLAVTLDTLSDVVYCPRRVCQYPVSLEPEESMGRCPSCQFVFCIYCKMTYHGVEPCRLKTGELPLSEERQWCFQFSLPCRGATEVGQRLQRRQRRDQIPVGASLWQETATETGGHGTLRAVGVHQQSELSQVWSQHRGNSDPGWWCLMYIGDCSFNGCGRAILDVCLNASEFPSVIFENIHMISCRWPILKWLNKKWPTLKMAHLKNCGWTLNG